MMQHSVVSFYIDFHEKQVYHWKMGGNAEYLIHIVSYTSIVFTNSEEIYLKKRKGLAFMIKLQYFDYKKVFPCSACFSPYNIINNNKKSDTAPTFMLFSEFYCPNIAQLSTSFSWQIYYQNVLLSKICLILFVNIKVL